MNSFPIEVAFSAYNLGELVSFVLPGYLIDRFGARRVGGVALILTALATGVAPLLAYLSLWALSASRVVVSPMKDSPAHLNRSKQEPFSRQGSAARLAGRFSTR